MKVFTISDRKHTKKEKKNDELEPSIARHFNFHLLYPLGSRLRRPREMTPSLKINVISIKYGVRL